MQKTLKSLSVVEHSMLKEAGMLWEFFPEATGTYAEDCKAPLAYEKAEDPNVDAVVRSYLDRAAAGMLKYGVTTEDNPLSLEEWINHAQQEAMDFTIYLERIKQELRAAKSHTDNYKEKDK